MFNLLRDVYGHTIAITSPLQCNTKFSDAKGTSVGRPKQGIISKEAVLEIALEIINSEGLGALNVRRIADKIGVNAASLYNHFKSKEEIITGAAELALEKTPFRLPLAENSEWQELLFAGVLQERDFLLAHPELLSFIIRRRSEGFANNYLEHLTKRLLDMGVSIEILDPIYNALECYTIGHVSKLIVEKGMSRPKSPTKGFPFLAESVRKRFLSEDEVFNVSVLSIISAIKFQYDLRIGYQKPTGEALAKRRKLKP